MAKLIITLIISLLLYNATAFSQRLDSSLHSLQNIREKYLNSIDKKVNQYTHRITTKTLKTLTKLSRWENKIKGLLLKVSPETTEQLFGNNQPTFTSLLQQLKEGEAMVLSYQAPYNKYNDELNTSLKYLAQQKEQLDSGLIKKIEATSRSMQELVREEDRNEALLKFIKERKKQLIDQTFQYIGKSKYLIKINKEAYYYAEAIKNYKELFSDSKKAEEMAMAILKRIPAFQQFFRNNSQLTSVFPQPGGNVSLVSTTGLQTRASVQSLIQGIIESEGLNTQQLISQNLQQARGQLSKLKDKLMSTSMVTEGGVLPDFKPNEQKSKTFKQRLEYGANLQSQKNNTFLPVTSDLALTAGYKLNDKSIIGIGASYKLGWGSGWRHIKFSNEGVGLRSFLDMKLKGNLWISGGYEQNYQTAFKDISELKNLTAWQASGLIGVTKKIKGAKRTKNIQLLWDFLSYQQIPKRQPILFRIGYTLK